MRQISYIVLHCTAGPQTQSIAEIQAYWKKLGWKRPGYHYIIKPDGEIESLQDMNQPTNGVAGFNANSIHISYIGGVGKNGEVLDNRTPLQKQAMAGMVRQLHTMFPNAIILGHRDFSPDKNRDGIIQPNEWMKSCPSFSVKDWLIEENIMQKPPTFQVKKLVKSKTGANINLRAGGSLNHPIIASVPNGTAAIILMTGKEWTMVRISDKLVGYIKNDFII